MPARYDYGDGGSLHGGAPVTGRPPTLGRMAYPDPFTVFVFGLLLAFLILSSTVAMVSAAIVPDSALSLLSAAVTWYYACSLFVAVSLFTHERNRA